MTGAPSPIFWTLETITRSPAIEAVADDVVVADHLTEVDRLLPRDEALLALLGDEHEVLAGDAADGDSTGTDQTRIVCSR